MHHKSLLVEHLYKMKNQVIFYNYPSHREKFLLDYHDIFTYKVFFFFILRVVLILHLLATYYIYNYIYCINN